MEYVSVYGPSSTWNGGRRIAVTVETRSKDSEVKLIES